jgi:hypothetical protein
MWNKLFHILFCFIYHNQTKYKDNNFILYIIIQYNSVSIFFFLSCFLYLIYPKTITIHHPSKQLSIGIALSVFESVVMVAFQSVFYLEMHQNNIFFYFLKIIFDISVLKQ